MDKRIPLPARVYNELEAKAKAEGKAPDELASKIVQEKATEKPEKKKGTKKSTVQKEGEAPVEAQPATVESNSGKQPFINPYGFIHLPKDVQGKFGVQPGKKTPITIEVQGDTLIIKKT